MNASTSLTSWLPRWFQTASRWSKVAGGVLVVVILAGIYGAMAHWRLFVWLDRDGTAMRHFPALIYDEGVLNISSDERLEAIERALVQMQLDTGRDLVSLSRSEPRREPWGRFTYVKVFLRTALPGSPTHTVAIKFAVRLRLRGGRVQILGTDQLGL